MPNICPGTLSVGCLGRWWISSLCHFSFHSYQHLRTAAFHLWLHSALWPPWISDRPTRGSDGQHHNNHHHHRRHQKRVQGAQQSERETHPDLLLHPGGSGGRTGGLHHLQKVGVPRKCCGWSSFFCFGLFPPANRLPPPAYPLHPLL